MPRVRILVVDDHELVRRNICRFLEDHSEFEVICEASSGLEAIRQAEQHHPDIILLDISLPELNGLAALPIIRKIAPTAKIIMVSNHDSAVFVRDAFAAGAVGFVTKSDLSPQLMTAMREAQENRTFVSRSVKRAPETVLTRKPPASDVEA